MGGTVNPRPQRTPPQKRKGRHAAALCSSCCYIPKSLTPQSHAAAKAKPNKTLNSTRHSKRVLSSCGCKFVARLSRSSVCSLCLLYLYISHPHERLNAKFNSAIHKSKADSAVCLTKRAHLAVNPIFAAVRV